MALHITSLNSGSNGNCYYIGNDTDAVLIDVGISCRETEKRMKGLGLSMQKVKAVFVSHEHGDHIKGVAVLAEKYGLPVYITHTTLLHAGNSIRKQSAKTFIAYEPVFVGGLAVTAFPKEHDAGDPHSFIINGNGVTIGVFTDIGAPCDHLIKHFGQCHAAFLEANYDDELLMKGRYPQHLKNRIRGGKGHLSNSQALEIFMQHRPPFMTHLLLSHLSKDNNDPQLVQQLFTKQAGETKIIIASRYEPTAVHTIREQGDTQISKTKIKLPVPVMQLNLFGS